MLANGINNALVSTFGSQIEFVLIVALPSDEKGYVELSTITGITEPDRLDAVAHHISDLARANRQKDDLATETDVQGHA